MVTSIEEYSSLHMRSLKALIKTVFFVMFFSNLDMCLDGAFTQTSIAALKAMWVLATYALVSDLVPQTDG